MIRLTGLVKWKSAKRLAEKLAEMEPLPDLTVSWGMEAPGVFGGKPRLDGLSQLRRFSQAGVRCPTWTTDPTVVRAWLEAGRATGGWGTTTGEGVWGRRVNHTKGKDIRVPGQRGFWESEFWVRVIPDVVDEWRVHVFEGRVIGQGHKFYHGEETRKYPDPRIRSRDNGWRMTHKERAPQRVQEVAIAGCRAVGYDFAAMDCYVTEGGEVGVFEANSAPGMDDYTATRYAEAIARKARER